MGLFKRKQQKKDSVAPKTKVQQYSVQPTPSTDATRKHIEKFFDEQLREELRTQGRQYFEEIIRENAVLFRKDLESTVGVVRTKLREHTARQIDEQLAEYRRSIRETQASAVQSLNRNARTLEEKHRDLGKDIERSITQQQEQLVTIVKDVQDLTVKSLNQSAEKFEEQHKELAAIMQKNIAYQQAALADASEESKAQIEEMKAAQTEAVASLNRSAESLNAQYKELGESLQKNITQQQQSLTQIFEENMAQIVEHYLVGVLGDQIDLQSQLPGIIEKMEAQKQDIVDDMKL